MYDVPYWLDPEFAEDELSDPYLPVYTVPELLDQLNQVLDASFYDVAVEGEIASFKVNQGKWVFFDLKDADTSLGCFMPLHSLTVALEDGMKVRLRAVPKVTRWGKFSLTIKAIQPVGTGSIKKSFEILKRKLAAEGLFDYERKRDLPDHLTHIGVISSTNAAGYHDFLKILDNRWGGLKITTVNTQVQGLAAPEQIIRALHLLNQRPGLQVIAILRGGGSADDLAAFNDEQLVRAIAASRLPVITGIGHEVDESLADLVADLRASTPSNAAERLTPDRRTLVSHLQRQVAHLPEQIFQSIDVTRQDQRHQLARVADQISHRLDRELRHVRETLKILRSLNPETTLERGYAILTGKLSPGSTIKITTKQQILTAEIKNAQKR